MASAPAPFQDLVCFGPAGNIYMCDNFGTWVDRGMLGGWPLAMCGTDAQGHFFGVGLNGGMDYWDFGKNGWTNTPPSPGYPAPDGWDNGIGQFTIGPPGTVWLVSRDGNIARSTDNDFEDVTAALGGWTVKMMSYDGLGYLWCVGSGGNVGQLMENDTWSDYSVAFSNWPLNGLFYGPDGIAWLIGTGGNVVRGGPDSWVDYGVLGGQAMRWLYWPAAGTFPLPLG